MENREKNWGMEGVVHSLVLFHNKATIFPCASRTPFWENPKGCIQFHTTGTEEKQGRKEKPEEEEERRKKQRWKEAIVFLAIPNALLSGFFSSPSPLNSFALGWRVLM